jgi:hypothetical protein
MPVTRYEYLFLTSYICALQIEHSTGYWFANCGIIFLVEQSQNFGFEQVKSYLQYVYGNTHARFIIKLFEREELRESEARILWLHWRSSFHDSGNFTIRCGVIQNRVNF